MADKILVVAAHPDDEMLGCGGTMARHVAEGDEVHVVIMAEGVTSRDSRRVEGARTEALSILEDASRRANARIGVASVKFLGLPDNRMDSLDRLDIVKLIERELVQLHPRVVYTHHAGDLNLDHGIVHVCVLTACRPQPGRSVETVLCFEVPSSTEWQPPNSGAAFAPDWFVDISGTLASKIEALGHYESEMREWPHARSIRAVEHLARWRGATVGVEAAEAFSVARHIRPAR